MKQLLKSAFWLSVVLVICSLLLIPAAAETVDAMTVYVDQENGSDTQNGLTEATAVQTFDAAYKLLDAGLSASGTGTIVLVEDYTWTFTTDKKPMPIAPSVTTHAYQVVITAKTPDIYLKLSGASQSALHLSGPTRFENMGICIAQGGNKFHAICGAGVGGRLVIGENVTTSANLDNRPTLHAAPTSGTNVAANAGLPMELEINSGDWRTVYAGGYAMAVYGEATLVMNGGSAYKMAAIYNKAHNGNVSFVLNGGTITEFCPGAGNASGSIKGNVTVTLAGTYPTKISTYGTVSGTVSYDLAPNGLELPEGKYTVRNVTGGNLILNPNASLEITGTVSGTTNISFTDAPATGAVYVTAPEATADDAFTFEGTTATVATANGVKTWTSAGEYVFKGLVLEVKYSASNPYNVALYKGLKVDSANLVAPTDTVTENGMTRYYYENLPAGNYYTQVYRQGFYTVKKAHSFTAAQMEEETLVHVSTAMRVFENGELAKWQTTAYQEYSDPMMETLRADGAAWRTNYGAYLTTPVFTVEGKAHQATTQVEMENYIASLDTADDNMYVYSIGKSEKYAMDIPVVIFTKTDLSSAKTLEEAAALINANNKLTVHYQAQIHGNEPAGGEAALAEIGRLDTAYGDSLLETINIYVIPRLNPDGSLEYKRNVPKGLNGNRDMLLLQTAEVQAHHYIYNLFMPEVAIDSHEYTMDSTAASGYYKDMMVGCGYNGNSGEAFAKFTEDLALLAIPALEANDLEFSFYTNITNNNYSVSSSIYMGLRGSVSLLLESRGIGFGNHTMDRRVASHLVTLDTILTYIAQNHAEVQAVSDAERQRIAENGKTYEDTDVLVLQHKKESDSRLVYTNTWYDYLTGVATSVKTITPTKYVADTTRVRPTAYVIPAGMDWTQDVLDLMDQHNAYYYFVEAGTAIDLQQYVGTVSSATLTEEQTVVFGKGAYVLPLNQSSALVMTSLMEPDLVDEYGVDTGNGTTEKVGTLAQVGIIPVNGDQFPIYRYVHDLNKDGKVDTTTGEIPAVEYTVYIHSQNGLDTNDAYSEAAPAKTIEHAFAQLGKRMMLAPEGAEATVVFMDLYELGTNGYTFPSHDYPVVLTSLTGAEGLTKSYLKDNGWFAFSGDVTLDKITVKATVEQDFYYIFANGHNLTVTDTVNTPATPKGHYFTISAGAYSDSVYGGNVQADPVLQIYGGSWKYLYASSYVGTLIGNPTVIVDGASFEGIMPSYAANTKGDISISLKNASVGQYLVYMGNGNKNNVTGNVTLTLGENVTASDIYMGSRDAGNVSGNVTIVQDGADLSSINIHKGAKNAGTVGKTVFAYKSGNTDPISGYDLVQVWMEEGWQDLTAAITKLSLKPADTGFGYKAEFTCDGALQSQISEMGFKLWLSEDQVVSRRVNTFRENLTLRLKNFDLENYGSTPVHAQVYVKFSNGLTVESTTVAYSMQYMVEYISANLTRFTAGQITGVQTMLTGCEAAKSWNVEALLNWTEE